MDLASAEERKWQEEMERRERELEEEDEVLREHARQRVKELNMSFPSGFDVDDVIEFGACNRGRATAIVLRWTRTGASGVIFWPRLPLPCLAALAAALPPSHNASLSLCLTQIEPMPPDSSPCARSPPVLAPTPCAAIYLGMDMMEDVPLLWIADEGL